MNPGDPLIVDNFRLLQPLKGTIVTVTIGGKEVRARVMEIEMNISELKVVSNDVRK